MYAIIRTGGKQYTVKPGDILHVEKLEKDLGSEFDIQDVLMLGGEQTHIGQPLVKNAKVTVVVTKQARTRKVIVFKKKRRHSFRKFKTHKQQFTELFVKSITSPDGKTAASDEKPVVKDMAAIRDERIESKMIARVERVSNRGEASAEAPKKETKKAAAPKKSVKKAAAKKGGKKTAAKKSAGKKKTAKKTSKKA